MSPRASFSRALPRLPLFALAGAGACVLPMLAAAQSAPVAPLAVLAVPALNETVVTANRVAQPLSDLVADVSIVDRETIEASGATGVLDVLARLPGIEISRNGSIGTTSSVFLRGAETRFTAVYLDGVLIHQASPAVNGFHAARVHKAREALIHPLYNGVLVRVESTHIDALKRATNTDRCALAHFIGDLCRVQ